MVALASRYLMPCTCPSFAPNEDRLFRLRQAVADFRIEGVLYHVLKGCVIYDFELLRVEALMAELGVPVLRIETDYNPEDIEQLRTRVEAFVEMIREKKRKGVGR
jgi:benzoyl-CoA reductase/2-hydroxyglutaryl-CoA dehydratase subunit BcrC/BadD/HgdB